MKIRLEQPGDEAAISALIEDAFASAEHSDGTEAQIVERLRQTGALTASLVAVEGGDIVGHVALSPITIGGRPGRWFGLGPVAVSLARQGEGLGNRLIRAGLDLLKSDGAAGCVVLGEPAYYGRFGFKADERLRYPGPPPEYFQALALEGGMPIGIVAYHPAFG